ncbi:prefoldin subunit beta [Nanoarchaeota archaeon]
MVTKKEAEEKISQLQLIEQSVQTLLVQKQQLQAQQQEIESALDELSKTDKAYKIVGNLMIASDKEELKKYLQTKKDTLDLRVKSIEKQENQLKEKAESTRSQIMEGLKK